MVFSYLRPEVENGLGPRITADRVRIFADPEHRHTGANPGREPGVWTVVGSLPPLGRRLQPRLTKTPPSRSKYTGRGRHHVTNKAHAPATAGIAKDDL